MTETRSPGWYPDPEHPTNLLRRWDGAGWTDDEKPVGYVVQPGGPSPVAEEPVSSETEMFGAAPNPTGGRAGARRRLRVAVVLSALVAVVIVVILLIGLLAG